MARVCLACYSTFLQWSLNRFKFQFVFNRYTKIFDWRGLFDLMTILTHLLDHWTNSLSCEQYEFWLGFRLFSSSIFHNREIVCWDVPVSTLLIFLRSCKYRMNNNGPSLLPWGTPVGMWHFLDNDPSTLIWKDLSFKYEWTNFIKYGVKFLV